MIGCVAQRLSLSWETNLRILEFEVTGSTEMRFPTKSVVWAVRDVQGQVLWDSNIRGDWQVAREMKVSSVESGSQGKRKWSLLSDATKRPELVSHSQSSLRPCKNEDYQWTGLWAARVKWTQVKGPPFINWIWDEWRAQTLMRKRDRERCQLTQHLCKSIPAVSILSLYNLVKWPLENYFLTELWEKTLSNTS